MAKVIETPKRAKRCETCRFYDLEQRDCHANFPIGVPIPAPGGQLQVISMFVPMKPEQWCAKWEGILPS